MNTTQQQMEEAIAELTLGYLMITQFVHYLPSKELQQVYFDSMDKQLNLLQILSSHICENTESKMAISKPTTLGKQYLN